MNIQDQNIEQLLERFFEGDTTREEEKFLEKYFTGENVAENLMQYKPMFHWYADGMPGEPGVKPADTDRPIVKKRSWLTPKPLIWFSSVAAALAVLFTIGWNYHTEKIHKEMLAKQHEGSYIIIDGVLYTDIDEISDEIEYLKIEAETIELELSTETGGGQDIIS